MTTKQAKIKLTELQKRDTELWQTVKEADALRDEIVQAAERTIRDARVNADIAAKPWHDCREQITKLRMFIEVGGQS